MPGGIEGAKIAANIMGAVFGNRHSIPRLSFLFAMGWKAAG